MADKVTLVKGKQRVTSSRPTTVTQLKSQGFVVEKPAPKPAPPKTEKAESGDK